MNFEQIALIGEFVGGLGVLATLVFLIFEVRGNSRILKANAKTSGMESTAHYNEVLAQDEVLAGLAHRVSSGEPFDSLSSLEQFRLTLVLRGIIQRLEAMYFQYEAGLVDEEYWNTRRCWLKSMIDQPSLSKWWEAESASSMVTDQFIEHIAATRGSFILGPGAQIVPSKDGVDP
ncbi:MAG: hypothetical protein H6985_19955 [Pseudomonadales bacterium]|nr:hypothetical protein [Pseudomonadales bacterium]